VGLGLAAGILVVGHRLAHRIGAVQAIAGLPVCLVLLATSVGLAESIAVLVASGLCTGLANANLTDLALAPGGGDRRVATGAFNLVRWGAAAPAPITRASWPSTRPPCRTAWPPPCSARACWSSSRPGHVMAAGHHERVIWRARRTPEEATGEAF
jgi:MFS transporter, ACDE family, multidrug resistance protein